VSTGSRYTVIPTSAAKRDLKRFHKNASLRPYLADIDKKIRALGANPRPRGAIKLTGGSPPCEYRIRENDYRILYSIDDKNRIVHIGRVKDRKDAYGP
jgi:mRNA interferase RelE/StbE